MNKLFKCTCVCVCLCVCLRASAVWWGRWMMDARQESYATAPSALMARGRYTPAPNADLLLRMTQRFYTLTFCALYTRFLSLTHNGGTAGSIAPYPHWLCVVLNKALCSRQAHCIEFCTSYRWGTDEPLSGGLIGWSWGDSNTACTHTGGGRESCCWSGGNETVTLMTVFF